MVLHFAYIYKVKSYLLLYTQCTHSYGQTIDSPILWRKHRHNILIKYKCLAAAAPGFDASTFFLKKKNSRRRNQPPDAAMLRSTQRRCVALPLAAMSPCSSATPLAVADAASLVADGHQKPAFKPNS